VLCFAAGIGGGRYENERKRRDRKTKRKIIEGRTCRLETLVAITI